MLAIITKTEFNLRKDFQDLAEIIKYKLSTQFQEDKTPIPGNYKPGLLESIVKESKQEINTIILSQTLIEEAYIGIGDAPYILRPNKKLLEELDKAPNNSSLCIPVREIKVSEASKACRVYLKTEEIMPHA